MLGVAAEVEVGAGGVEGVELGELVAQLRQIGLEELRHEAAEYDVAVEREANVVDADGKIGTNDSAYVLRYAAEMDTLDDTAKACADVNGDGKADTNDAVMILQFAAEKSSGF